MEFGRKWNIRNDFPQINKQSVDSHEDLSRQILNYSLWAALNAASCLLTRHNTRLMILWHLFQCESFSIKNINCSHCGTSNANLRLRVGVKICFLGRFCGDMGSHPRQGLGRRMHYAMNSYLCLRFLGMAQS